MAMSHALWLFEASCLKATTSSPDSLMKYDTSFHSAECLVRNSGWLPSAWLHRHQGLGGAGRGVRYARARDCARIITVSETSIEYLESFWIEPRAFALSEAFKGRS